LSSRVVVFLAMGTILLAGVIGAGLWLGQPPPPLSSGAPEVGETEPEPLPQDVARPPAVSPPGEGETEHVTQPPPVPPDILVEPPTTASDNPAEAATVRARKVRVRAGPDTRYHAIANARKGQVLKISARLKGWCFVLLPSGLRGWIRCDLLEE
jgi:hypothetical protein